MKLLERIWTRDRLEVAPYPDLCTMVRYDWSLIRNLNRTPVNRRPVKGANQRPIVSTDGIEVTIEGWPQTDGPWFKSDSALFAFAYFES